MDISYIDRRSKKIITEQPPAEGLLQFLYHHPLGKHLLLPWVKRKWLSYWYGKWMDHPSSAKRIRPFVEAYQIDLSEARKSIDEFRTFNEFFYRKLKPEARPLGEHLICPGDGRVLAFANVNEIADFFIKGRRFTLRSLLRSDSLSRAFSDAPMLILRLAPNDYHRYHFPYDGIPAESVRIPGHYYSVSPHALDSYFPKIFGGNKREICVFTLPDERTLLIVPVGATMVGSICSTYTPEQFVHKGAEMGYFAFGGSTIILMLPNEAVISQDLIEHTRAGMETYVRMGETIARLD